MAVNVRIPEVLRKLTGGSDLVSVEASNVAEMLVALEAKYPGVKERICDEKGKVRNAVNIYVNEEDIRFQENTETKLSPGAEVSILPAIAGGNARAAKKEGDLAGSGEVSRRVYLTFTKELCTRPIIYEVVKKFDVIPNIRTASVTEDMGIMGVELRGPADALDKAVDWIRKQGVKVDPIEMNVVEP